MKQIQKNWHKVVLFLILALAGFLSFYAVWQEGYANQYYSAAVKSMLTSFHNFFFASLDSGGYVTVDKPALGLWLQAISALIFGFHGWSLILPEALSTVISVGLIYHIVSRSFGKTAGIVSALILSLTPILIAVSRTNDLDASLVMVLLFATWAMIIAGERGSLKHLLLSVVLVGLGFNIKMLEAFMVLPAFYIVYILASPLKLKKRIIHLSVATVVLLAVSLSWATIVDLTPAANRPYVGGSQTNSVIELALGYNGVQRITGVNSHAFNMPIDDGNRRIDGSGSANNAPNDGILNTTDGRSGSPGTIQRDSGMQAPPNGRNRQAPSDGNIFAEGKALGQGNNGFNGGPGGRSENGQKGILRIFNNQLAGQISWFLVMALFGILMLCFKAFNKKIEDRKNYIRHLILWSTSLILMIGYFSISAFFHRYYLSMLAPSIAALSGIGLIEMLKAYTSRGGKWILLPTALILSAAIQSKILWNYSDWRFLIPVICGITLLSVLTLFIIRLIKKDNFIKTIRIATATGLMALLITPSIWAYTPIMYSSQTTTPYAGPDLKSQNGGFNQMDGQHDGQNNNNFTINAPDGKNTSSRMVEFLLSKQQGEKYLVAVADANTASSIILQTGKAVMAVGGFSGSDNILTVDRLSKMVANGEIRYFQINGRDMGQQSDIAAWVEEHGTIVTFDGASTSAFDNLRGNFGNQGTLYDLAPEKG